MVIHDDWMIWGYPHEIGNLHLLQVYLMYIYIYIYMYVYIYMYIINYGLIPYADLVPLHQCWTAKEQWASWPTLLPVF